MPLDIRPPVGGTLSVGSPFGVRKLNGKLDLHTGIDFSGYAGKAIYAVHAGKVLNVYPNGSLDRYGNVVVLHHDGADEVQFSLYAHLSSFAVSQGQFVKKGDTIGTMGGTAASHENANRVVPVHLHFELLTKWPPAGKDLNRVDPSSYLGLPVQSSPVLLAQLTAQQATANMAESFGAVSQYLNENALALKNVITHKRTVSVNQRVISDIGFRELSNIGLPTQGAAPNFQTILSKPTTGTLRKDDFIPSIFAIYGVGGDAALAQLQKNRNQQRVVSAYTDSAKALGTVNPTKLIHHLISRRGDLTNSTAWNANAFHKGSKPTGDTFLTPYLAEIDKLSISIELEENYIRHTDEKSISPILNRSPCTEQQYAAVAFILK